jgi:uncharacterized membrane protein
MEERIELRPNCSLSRRGAIWFFVATCLFSLMFAFQFILRGYWPVLAYWVLEMAALGLALHLSMRRRNYTQTLTITDGKITCLTRSRRGEAKQEFARHWTKVRLRSPLRRLGVSRLTIESRGQTIEVGSFLTEEARASLARRLGSLVGGMNESPPLEVANLGDKF